MKSSAYAALVLALAAPLMWAQAPAGDITYTRQMIFRIPFEPVTGERNLRQVQLYYSADQGRSWHPYNSVTPERRGFDFRAERDGLYFFTVRTIDSEGRVFPPVLDGARPGLKVYVDTVPPNVVLRALPARDGGIGVEWEVRDENLDANTLRLDFRAPGNSNWVPLNVEPAATGQRYWNPGVAGAVEVRLSVYDKAGNLGDTTTTLGATGGFTSNPGTGNSQQQPATGTVMVNSTQIKLNYKIDEKGPSGVSKVELWMTRDGRTWNMHEEFPNPDGPLSFTVVSEGLYGITLLVKSGVGLHTDPPRPGDPPQMWVEVDTTKPTVKLGSVDVGRGPDSGKLTISWSAADKNLAQQPITLAYAEQKQGPWTEIAAKLDNTGRHVWMMPPGVPYQFFVRVQAHDRAGNIGSAETEQVVKVDLSVPRPTILGVESANPQK